MGYKYDSSGIDSEQSGGWQLLPEGDYTFRITDPEERESANGDYQVQLDAVVVEPKEWEKIEVRHWVTFFKDKNNKGAGISIAFLRAIGQPWEGPIKIEPEKWVGKRFRAHVTQSTYTAKDGTAKTNNKIKWLLERDHTAELAAETTPAPVASEDVPF